MLRGAWAQPGADEGRNRSNQGRAGGQMTMSEIEALAAFLRETPGGPIADTTTLQPLLASAWPDLGGEAVASTWSDKLGRAENTVWSPPVLTFTLERHGVT